MSEKSSLLSPLYDPQPSQLENGELIKIVEYILIHYGKDTGDQVYTRIVEQQRVCFPAHCWFLLFENGYIQRAENREITISSYNYEYYMKTVNHHSFICTNGNKFLDSLGKVIWGKYQKKKSFDQLYIEAYDELFNTNTGRIINQLR